MKRNRVWVVLGLLAVLAASAFVQSRGMRLPMVTYRDGNGVSQARIAWNYEKYGLWNNKLIPVFDKSPASELTPIFRLKYKTNDFFLLTGDKVVMAHYPPTLSLTLYAAFKVFGYSPFTTRLVPIIVTLLTLFVFFLTAQRLCGDATALTATLLFAMSPIVLAYGQMPDTIIFSLLSFLSALYFTLVWEDTRRARHLAGVLLSIIFGCAYGWFPYFLVPLLVGRHLFFRNGKFSMAFFFGVPAAATLTLAAFVSFLMWALGPAALHDWLSAYANRRGDVILVNDTHFAITTFQFFKTMILRLPFHYTWPVFLAAAAWLWGMRKRPEWRPGRSRAGALLVMLGFGIFPMLMFKQGAYIHGFYVYLFGPAVCLCAAIMLEKTRRMSWPARAAAAAAVALFLIGTFPRTKTITTYLSIEKAIKFNDFLDQVADSKTIVAQDVFNLHTLLWSSTFIDAFVLPNEMSHETFLKTLRQLPPGYRLIYIHLPLPDAMRLPETEKTLAYLYKRFPYHRKGDYIIFESAPGARVSVPRPAPPAVPGKPVLNFQNKMALDRFAVSGGADHVAGAGITLSYDWRCLEPMKDDFLILVRIVPGIVNNDHEPVFSTYQTRFWKRGETVNERYTIRIPATTPPGEYPVEIAVCAPRDDGAFCLEPEGGWTGDEQQFTRIGKIRILKNQRATPVPADPELLARTATMDEYLAFYNLRQFEFFIDFIGVDPTFDTMIKGWKDILMGDKDDAIQKLNSYSLRFAEFNMIEKMVSTAMQEVPAMLRRELIVMYLEKNQFLRAGREALSIAFNLPQSYQAYYKLGAKVDQNASDMNRPVGSGLMIVSDHFFGRMLTMRPGDFETRLIAAEHYLRTGRPERAFGLLRDNLGAVRENDLDAATLLGYMALSQNRTEDYALMRRRMAALNPAADLDRLVFSMILDRRDHEALFTFLTLLPSRDEQRRYWTRALKRFADERDLNRLMLCLQFLDPATLNLTGNQIRTLSGYYESMGIKAFEAGSVPDAIKLYESAHRLMPDKTGVMYNLALLYMRDGRPDYARDMLRKLLAQNPDDAGARALLEKITGKK